MSTDTPTGGSVTTLPLRPRQQRARATDERNLTDEQLAEFDRFAEIHAQRRRERSAPPTAPARTTSARAVCGWGNDNDDIDDSVPAVIVNPAASPAALLAWASGQLRQAGVLAEAVCCSTMDGGTPVDEVVGALRHLNQQALVVLEELAERLPPGCAPD